MLGLGWGQRRSSVGSKQQTLALHLYSIYPYLAIRPLVVVLKKGAASSAFLDKAIAFPWSAPTLAFARPVCHAVSEKLGSLFRHMLLVAGFSR